MERLESAGCFNTSHVTLYHLVGMCSTELCCCFNTSHVTLYLITHKSKDGTHGRFNTSHVTLYRFLSSPRLVYCPGFNTSHVTLYPGARPDSQNLFCFNTSHVTLYPPSEHTEKIRPACFNTSHVTLYLCGLELFHPFRTFQYISCYSLSLFHILQLKCIPRFNTSHVTLYLYQFHSLKKLLLCFNTSHVTLYPGHPFKCGWMGWVSIHLMLLFICLRNARFVHFSISFNTSHVTLYHGLRQCTIQKQSRFNTSHFTLYHPVKIRFRWD